MDVNRGREKPNLQTVIIIVRSLRPSSRITYIIKTGRLNVYTAFTLTRRPPSTSSTAAEVSETDLNADPKGEAHKSESTHATYNKRPQEYNILLLLLLL